MFLYSINNILELLIRTNCSPSSQPFVPFLENKILLTTGADILKEKDESDSKPQDITSVYGKLLSINLENNSFEIFNKGHRNSLGLLVDQDLILSTENGPRGGDEINLEIKDKNYGWDIASYGSKYSKNELYCILIMSQMNIKNQYFRLFLQLEYPK